MAKSRRSLTELLKSPVALKVAADFLSRKLNENPAADFAAAKEPEQILIELRYDAEELGQQCLDRLEKDEVQVLKQILRAESHHRRVYKRTVLLSPCAHLLLKTLSDLEARKMSEVIEVHLDSVLRERHGLSLRASVDERTGRVDYEVEPLA
jgi:hypothetical protein